MDLLLALLAIVAFAVVFPLFWCGVVLLLSVVGGWRGLAAQYGVDMEPPASAAKAHWQSGMIGLVNYSSTLNVAADAEAIWLRPTRLFQVGHRQLKIPWTEAEVSDFSFLFKKGVTIRTRSGKAIRVLGHAAQVVKGARPA